MNTNYHEWRVEGGKIIDPALPEKAVDLEEVIITLIAMEDEACEAEEEANTAEEAANTAEWKLLKLQEEIEELPLMFNTLCDDIIARFAINLDEFVGFTDSFSVKMQEIQIKP